MSDAPVRPRRLAHRGVVDASAFLVAKSPIGEVRAKERVVRLAAAADVYATEAGWIVRLRTPVSTACRTAPGVPFVAVPGPVSGRVPGRVHATAPLDEDEVLALAPPTAGDTFVVVRAGVAELVRLEAAIDPSEWLDVDAFVIADVASLGVAPRPPVTAIVPAKTTREVLGAGGPSPELVALANALRARAAARGGGAAGGAASGGAERGTASGSGGGGAFAAALAGVFGVLASFVGLFGGGRAPAGGGEGGGGGSSKGLASVPQEEPAGPSWLERTRSRILDLVARALVASRLAAVLERKHAEYLQKMMELFEKGNLDDALRWAIPLGDGTGDAADPAFLPPTPRAALDFNLVGGGRTRRALGLGESLFDHLKKRYREAFEKLSAAGRHRDAAFVLVELLGETNEAVSYLERHRLFTLAAELAEARKLSPGLVVRQWMLAGDRARAIALARRHAAFADAIARLETTDKPAARALRVLWADMLASAGAFAAAVDVVWEDPELRPLALRWLDHAIEAGGMVGARMLARKAGTDAEAFPDVRDAVIALLEDGSLDAGAMRASFGQALAKVPVSPEVRVLARATARALLRDRGDARVVEALLTAAADPVLTADAGAAPAVRAADPVRGDGFVRRELADRGALAVSDVAMLPGGRVLVALGEAGARIVGEDGRTLARFLEPAHAIVLSDHGDRALLLAARGDGLYRIARLDVVGRRVRAWCDARIDAFAPDFDGASWLVGCGGTLYVIDVLDEAFSALWELEEPATKVHAIARDATSIAVVRTPIAEKKAKVIAPPTSIEVWHYDDHLTLRRRRIVGGKDKPLRSFGAPAANGAIAALVHPPGGETAVHVEHDGRWLIAYVGVEETTQIGQTFDDDGVVIVRPAADGLTLRLAYGGKTGNALQIELAGARRAQARRQGDRLLVFDDCGRLLLVSIELRRLVHEWRLA